MAPVGILYRLVWGGRLFDTETWSCSLHVSDQTDTDTPAVDFRPALIAWATSNNTGLNSEASLDFIKYNKIDPITGRYARQVTNEHQQNDMAAGVNGVGAPQIALVVSLRTPLARGRAHAGRYYVPGGDFSIGTDGRITESAALAGSVSGSALVAAVNAVSADPATGVVVFSKVGQQVQPVVSTRVGRVLDTMRSRRSSLVEDPQTTVVTP